MLIDPVLNNYAAPFSFSNKAFMGTASYRPADMPEIDFLFITHDHYDHLDYDTIVALKTKVKQVVCPLGVGEHLSAWGYDEQMISEGDWYDSLSLGEGYKVHFEPSRHFSGRTLARNYTLWTSFLLEAKGLKIYMGGDSGYGAHFKAIGKKYGPIDLAILDTGQYNEAWHNIHALPEEVLKEADELQAKRLMPVHNSKFALAHHDWDEPMIRLCRENDKRASPFKLVTPLIGEIVDLGDTEKDYACWWEKFKDI